MNLAGLYHLLPSPDKASSLCPHHFKPSQLAALQVDGPEWNTPRSFYYSHMMLDDISLAYVSCLYTNFSFSLWNTPLIYNFPSANGYYLFRLINHENRIKISVCIHHISSATFATIANRNKPHKNYNLDALNINGFKSGNCTKIEGTC